VGHIDSGVSDRYLAKELELSLASVPTDTCGIDKCYGCGSFARQCLSGELVPEEWRRSSRSSLLVRSRLRRLRRRFRYRARYHKREG
jgi:hypothetical protein